MSYYRRIQPPRRNPTLNNYASRQSTDNHHDDISYEPCCEDCYQLEEATKGKQEEISIAQETLDELKNLVDWLKRDVEKVRGRIISLEQGDEETEDEDSHGSKQNRGQPVGKQSIRIKLSEAERRLSELQQKEHEYHNVIDELHRKSQLLFEELGELRVVERDQAKDLRINREIKDELFQRSQQLLGRNKKLRTEIINSQTRRMYEKTDWSVNNEEYLFVANSDNYGH